MRSVIKLVFVMMAVGMLVISGCGGDSSEGESQEVTLRDTTSQEPEQEIQVPRMEFASGTPEAELQGVISEVIAYFQNDDIKGMMYKFIPEDKIKELEESGGFDRVAVRYNMFRDDMLLILSEALSLRPQFNEDMTVATYKVQSGPTDLVFVKDGDRWYFPDK